MFATDSLGELRFVLEFNLPKEISDNQEHIKLSVHHVDVPIVEVPICPIGYKCIPIKKSGEIHCIESCEYIKDVLPLINKWANDTYRTCSKLLSSKSDLFVKAKLYAYKKDNSLLKKWWLVEFYPLFNSNIEFHQLLNPKFTNDVELIFKFKNIIDENN